MTDEELKKEYMRQEHGGAAWNNMYTPAFNAWNERRGTTLNSYASNPASEETLNRGAEEATNIEHRVNNATTPEERDAVAEEARIRMNATDAARDSTPPREPFNPNNAEAEEPSLQLPEESPAVTEIKSTLTEGEGTADIDTIMNKPEIKEEVSELGIDSDREVPPTTEELQAATEEAAVKANAIGASPETVDAINKAAQGDGKDIENAGKSEYEKAREATDSDYAMSKWDRLSKILTVVSAFVHVISEGTIPPIDFTEFSQYNQKKEKRDATTKMRFEKDLGTEAEITDMLGEIQKGRAWDEEKTKEVQNIIIQEGLQEKIKEEHPDWNKEQVMQEAIKQAEDTFQRRNAAANTEGTAAGNADLGTRLRDQKFAEHCSPKEAHETIQQIDEQIRQIDDAIIALKDKKFDKGIEIYNNMVSLFAGLSSTASTESESTDKNKSKSEGSNDGLNGGAGAGAGPFNINIGGSYGSSESTSEGSSNSKARTVGRTEANREGLGVAEKLSDDYNKNTDADYKKAIANLEAMKQDLVRRRSQFEAKAKEWGRDNNVTNINDSDVKKKHVYIPKEKRLKR